VTSNLEQTTSDNLARRHEVEIVFHDKKAKRGFEQPARFDFYGSGIGEEHFRLLTAAAGSLKGKTVLDFGCGLGHTSRLYAEMGASRVEGFDISGENIAIAKKNAERDHLDDRVFFKRVPAEEIDYPNDFFDLVLGKAILHHTDLDKTGAQLYRVLRPGGSAYFLEPLAHNPFINVFRSFTPSRRTPTEKPLRIEDLNVFRRYFEHVSYQGFYVLPLLADALLLVTGSRSWYAKSVAKLLQVEKPLLTRFPSLQKYGWTALLELRKSR
jgi:SAM-dependent methyltransferase